MLPDGRYVVGRKLDHRLAALDPATLQWTELNDTGKSDFNAEEGWTLMPDGSILTFDVKHAPHSERYIDSEHKWVSAGTTIVDLHSPYVGSCIPYGGGCYHPPGEVGPGVLRPDGTVFATGSASKTGAGHTAIYHPSIGKWTVGPDCRPTSRAPTCGSSPRPPTPSRSRSSPRRRSRPRKTSRARLSASARSARKPTWP